ncbi:MAG: thioredoxin family protein [Bacteroidetes bacterium]|nr:thioredoxin family protein [Bacteroidota bacterium]
MKMIRKFFLFLVGILLSAGVWSQPYEVFSERPGEKTIKGHFSRMLLETDTSFHWYAPTYKNYKARPDALENIRKQKDSVEIVAFMGTWCEDSHFIIPQLIALLDSAQFPREKFSLIGVDRNKKTVGRLSEALNITLVPTILVFRNGKEVGRIVEYGKYGMFDKELAEILR